MSIIPVPTTRVGDFFVRQRLTEQVLADQLALFRLQSQVSTGRRIHLPSEDAPAALRAINLQRLLDRKGQVKTNVQASASNLAAAETALGQVSGQLSELRGAVLEVAGTLATDTQRRAVIQQVDRTLQFLVDTANAQSQGRYLFAGSRSLTQPYQFHDEFVEYFGNESHLRSYVDLDRLFATNLPGGDVFGGISEGVAGTVDLNPHLTADTLLSTIHGGNGISPNAAIEISVQDGAVLKKSVVDLSRAATIGDVARMIEAGAPEGSSVTVEVTGTGLRIESASGTIAISEVAEGRTAKELGVFHPSSAPLTSTIVGTDLDPSVLKTTPLANLLGTKAAGRLLSPNANNDLVITATRNGAEFNGVTVEFIAGAVAGSETAAYDEGTNTLTVQIQPGASTAIQVAAAITAEGTFTAALDHRDATSSVQMGTGTIGLATFGAVTSGGSGEVLDTVSGLLITHGGTSVELDISQAETVEDLLNRINGAGLALLAEINAAGTGINVRSRLSGADLTIGENGGTTATQLGIRTYTGATRLEDFNRGLGVPTSTNPLNDDLLIVARDGTELSINLTGAKTVQDVIDAVNQHPDNHVNTTAVVARLAATGNGIELVDMSSVTVGDLIVQAVEGSQAAEFLGFVPAGQSQYNDYTLDADGNFVLSSSDRHTLEAESVFNTLLRLRTALEQNDIHEIGRSLDRLDADLDRVSFARADIGSRLRDLEIIGIRLEDENVQLRAALSDDLDVDLAEAISNLMARQFAYEASLRTAGGLLQLSLLDFI